MFLLLQTGMIGVFLSLDFFLFYVFWELVLVPMYFIIGVWGGPRKLYAAIKFFLYTLAGSVLMLLGILTLYFAHFNQFGFYTFEIAELMKLNLPLGTQQWVFWAFFIGFAIKVPDVPVPHLAARRARGGAHRGLGDPGRRAAENGDVRLPALLAAAAAQSVDGPEDRADPGHPLHHRHHLRSARQPDAGGLEEADRLFLGEPPRLLHPRHLLHEPQRHRRLRAATGQSRNLHRHALPRHRRHLRAPPHPRDQGVRRPRARHAQVRHHLRHRHAQLGRPAAAERLRRRVHHHAGRLRGQPHLGRLRRHRRDSGRRVPPVALSAHHARPGDQRQEPDHSRHDHARNRPLRAVDRLVHLDRHLPQALLRHPPPARRRNRPARPPQLLRRTPVQNAGVLPSANSRRPNPTRDPNPSRDRKGALAAVRDPNPTPPAGGAQ